MFHVNFTKLLAPYSLIFICLYLSIVWAGGFPLEYQISNTTLQLSGQATRKKVFFVKIYDISLYLPKNITNHNHLTINVPQAYAIRIRYKSDKSVGIPQAWKEELLPALSKQQKKNLKVAFKEAKRGEIFKIEYTPSLGTKIYLEDELLLHEENYELMTAFNTVWLGPKPISKRIAKSLLPHQ